MPGEEKKKVNKLKINKIKIILKNSQKLLPGRQYTLDGRHFGG